MSHVKPAHIYNNQSTTQSGEQYGRSSLMKSDPSKIFLPHGQNLLRIIQQEHPQTQQVLPEAPFAPS